MKAECANCETVFEVPEDSSLSDIPHLWERVEPGGEVPACECPECGALAYRVVLQRRREKSK